MANGHIKKAEALRRWADAEEGLARFSEGMDKEHEENFVEKMRDQALHLDEKQRKIQEGLDHERNGRND